ncbi:P450 family fatty acid hydroxylase [Rhizoctonia solani AG-1 IA]|uniref:p450 family fatty acid hydroxylase n=1 Tax=Thanatephorus cucumeris (strain AG1-IA) TaxID=983506 RepID=L8WPX8_THACA|nr:P450 family fatty acid hydroxylase [Rhizoctonia solani AG-1 IA]
MAHRGEHHLNLTGFLELDHSCRSTVEIDILPHITNWMDKRSNDRGIHALESQSLDGSEPSKIYEINAYELANQILEDYTQPDSKYVQGLTGSLGIIHAYFTPKPSDYVEPDTWNNVRKSFSQKFVESPLQKWGFSGMDDITQQLVLKWESLVQDFFLLALDSMGLSVLNMRFNSFYKSELVPFVGYLYELAERLSEAKPADWAIPDPNSGQSRPDKPPVQGDSTIDTKEVDGLANLVLDRLKEGRVFTVALTQNVWLKLEISVAIRKRVISPNKYDVLSDIMQVDEKKRDENLVRLQIDSSGLNPNDVHFEGCCVEISRDVVCRYDRSNLNRMPYLTAVLEETLRLHPPVPKLAFFASEDKAFNDTTIPKGSKIFIDVESILKDTDPIAWGKDANEFKPERMEGIKFEDDKRLKSLEKSKDTYFGNPFITMLAKLAIVSLFQRFDFKLVDADYHLNWEQQIGPVPGNLLLHASLRGQSQSSAGVTEEPPVSQVTQTPTPHTPEKKETPIYILWGGRDGTCENYAETLLRWAPIRQERRASKRRTGDHNCGYLRRYARIIGNRQRIENQLTWAIGYPTENAKDFHAYLSKLVAEKSTELEGVKYAVFGCGRSGWSDTYQKVPIEFDDMLTRGGAEKLINRGEFDAGRPFTADAFDDWAAKLWNVLSKQYNVTYDESLYREVYEIRQIGNADARHRILRQKDTISAVVVENRTISNPDGTLPARHIELRMRVKEACKYQPGDVISVLPTNPIEDVHRVFRHFRMPLEQEFRVEKLSSSVFETLPAGERVKVFELLINFVELGKPAQKSHLRILMKHTRNEDTKRELQSEINTSLANTIKNHLSILDYLEKYRDIELPFNKFFIMLPYMRTREYSISSSPLWKPNTLTLSYQEHTKGVSSGYLARQSPGDVIRFTWRVSSHAHFGLPERPDKDGKPVPANEAEKPVVMFATGTGIAPFRSMIQDRWVRARQGEKVGKMILFFGCRDPKKEFLYADSDLKDWMDQKNWKGERLLDVRPAFSRPPDEAAKVQSSGLKLFFSRAQKDADLLIEVHDNGARYLTCGNVAASKGLEAVGKEIVRKGHEKKGKTPPPPEEIKKFIGQIYFTDVFG